MRAFWWSTVAGVLLVTGFALWVIYAKPFPRDGSSVARAVIISPGENQLAAEYAWIAKHPEGATFPVEQALFCRAGCLYEKWTFGASNQREVYFDLGMNAKICDANSESGFIK